MVLKQFYSCFPGGGAQGASGGTNGKNGSDFGTSYNGGTGSGFDLFTVTLESFVLSPGVGGEGDEVLCGGGGGGVVIEDVESPERTKYQGQGWGGAGLDTMSPLTASRGSPYSR